MFHTNLFLYGNDRLTWSSHFEFLIGKLSKRLYVLRILKGLLSHDELVEVYNAIIRSCIDYASQVFVKPGIGLNKCLTRFCKRAFKIIHGFEASSCTNCSMLNLQERRETLALRLYCKILSNPNHVLFDLLPEISARSGRIILPLVNSARATDGFIFCCS